MSTVFFGSSSNLTSRNTACVRAQVSPIALGVTSAPQQAQAVVSVRDAVSRALALAEAGAETYLAAVEYVTVESGTAEVEGVA